MQMRILWRVEGHAMGMHRLERTCVAAATISIDGYYSRDRWLYRDAQGGMVWCGYDDAAVVRCEPGDNIDQAMARLGADAALYGGAVELCAIIEGATIAEVLREWSTAPTAEVSGPRGVR